MCIYIYGDRKTETQREKQWEREIEKKAERGGRGGEGGPLKSGLVWNGLTETNGLIVKKNFNT